MAYSDTLNLVTGDTLPELTFTLKDSNAAATGKTLDPNDNSTWAPIDLSGVGTAVKLRLRALGSTTVKATLPCTITDATGGEVATNFSINSVSVLDTAGTFEGELELTTSTGDIQTVNDLIKFKVRADFD